jgi:hypothetical protein
MNRQPLAAGRFCNHLPEYEEFGLYSRLSASSEIVENEQLCRLNGRSNVLATLGQLT